MTTIDPGSIQRKPTTVAIVQWLAYINDALTILGGILFLSLRNDVELEQHYYSTEVTISAIVAIVIG